MCSFYVNVGVFLILIYQRNFICYYIIRQFRRLPISKHFNEKRKTKEKINNSFFPYSLFITTNSNSDIVSSSLVVSRWFFFASPAQVNGHFGWVGLVFSRAIPTPSPIPTPSIFQNVIAYKTQIGLFFFFFKNAFRFSPFIPIFFT